MLVLVLHLQVLLGWLLLRWLQHLPCILACLSQHDLQVVGPNVLEGPEKTRCLRSKRITQHMGEPQLQQA
jgi:hypothetical protein